MVPAGGLGTLVVVPLFTMLLLILAISFLRSSGYSPGVSISRRQIAVITEGIDARNSVNMTRNARAHHYGCIAEKGLLGEGTQNRTRCGRMEQLDEHDGCISFMEALGEETRRCPMGCTASLRWSDCITFRPFEVTWSTYGDGLCKYLWIVTLSSYLSYWQRALWSSARWDWGRCSRIWVTNSGCRTMSHKIGNVGSGC